MRRAPLLTLPLLALLVAGPLAAQDAPPDPPARSDPPARPAPPMQPDEGSDDATLERFRQLPPSVQLGARVETVRRRTPVHPTLVIVPEPHAYADAISRWTPELRFPVLIDDGTPGARHDIARFVRAFRPERVVRWEGERVVWPQSVEAQRSLLQDVIAQAWGAESWATVGETWREAKLVPPGVVLLSEQDPAWTGGLALAAGRGQIPAWFTPDESLEGIGGEMTPQQLAALRDGLAQFLDGIGLPWRDEGDIIEAVTLAANAPGRTKVNDEILALTDLLGRHSDGSRFAWAGLITGTEAEAAYRAMSSLFLQPRRAWLFNGYPKEGAFGTYDITKAGESLLEARIQPDIYDEPRTSIAMWRRLIAGGLDAGFVHVNSAGMRRWFNLNPGRAVGADVPVLNAPALVHFIHSFSAQNPEDSQSIAARWLDFGAFVYIGAVDEPYLTAFHTPGNFVNRLRANAPLGAAARHDQSPPWKIQIFGDPLYTLGPTAPRAEGEPDLPGAASLESEMRDAVRAQRFADALRTLTLLGRDADAARLYGAVLFEQDREPEADSALAAIPSLFREKSWELLADAAARAPVGAIRQDSEVFAMLWHALPRMSQSPGANAPLTRRFRELERRWNLVEDADALATAIALLEGNGAARDYAQEALAKASRDSERERISAIMTRY